MLFETDVVPLRTHAHETTPWAGGGALETSFPNANLEMRFVSKFVIDIKKAWVKFCPACRAAFSAWSPPPANTPANH